MPESPASKPEAFAAYQISQTMMFGLRELYRLFDGDITMAIVLGELGQHVSAYCCSRDCPDQSPQSLRRSNAHSIAAASGIPRETVRRKLEKLIALGWITELPNGGVSLNTRLDTPLHLQFLNYNREMLSRMRQTVDILEGIEL